MIRPIDASFEKTRNKSLLESQKNDYISLIYDPKRTPQTAYPSQLIAYLMQRFELKPGMALLEVGCGRGDFLRAFQGAGLKCQGVDREASAQGLAGGIPVSACNIESERLPFGDATFDVVYHKSVLEHVYSPKNLMEETRRVLKPGGKCIILTPDWVSQMRVFYEDITHCRPYDINAMRDALVMYGFSDVVSERFNQLPVLWRSRALTVVARALGLFMNVQVARFITEKTKIKFFRWAVELMVLGYGVKPEAR
jgi:SAM-dependent methyltransferase